MGGQVELVNEVSQFIPEVVGRTGIAGLHDDRIVLSRFLSESFVQAIPLDERVARRYGRLFADLRRAGTPIPVNDIWLAAAALESGAHLVTFDQDFSRVSGLECSVLQPEATDESLAGS